MSIVSVLMVTIKQLTSKQKINEHDLVKQAGKQLLQDTYIIIT